MLRSSIALALVLTTAGALAGCSSSGNSGPSGPLVTALSSISDNANTRSYVEFGRPEAALTAAGGSLSSRPYGMIVGYGYSTLAEYQVALRQRVGLDFDHASWAVTVGQPPHLSGLVEGISVSGLAATAPKLGASVTHGSTGTTYRFAPDGSANVTTKLAAAFDGLAPFNVLRANGSTVRYARSSADLDLTAAGSQTLADNVAVRSIADCLGNPLAAALTDELPVPHAVADLPPDELRRVPPRTIGLAMLGVGVDGAKGHPAQQRMCLAATSHTAATTIASSVRQAVASGSSTQADQRWSTLIGRPHVSVDGSLVSLSFVSPTGNPLVLMQGLIVGDLPGLRG